MQSTEFSSATVTAKANIYFDGKVVSHTVVTSEGERKTLGIIFPGEYEFGTEAPERMEIIDGSCRVKVADAEDWVTVDSGDGFDVPGNSKFQIAVDSIAQYVCSFLSE